MDGVELRSELERVHADCFGWAMACCRRDRNDAEEVLQAVYLKVLDGRARYDGRSSFRTWLFGVIRRTAVSERLRWASPLARREPIMRAARRDSPRCSMGRASHDDYRRKRASSTLRAVARRRSGTGTELRADLPACARAPEPECGIARAAAHDRRGSGRRDRRGLAGAWAIDYAERIHARDRDVARADGRPPRDSGQRAARCDARARRVRSRQNDSYTFRGRKLT